MVEQVEVPNEAPPLSSDDCGEIAQLSSGVCGGSGSHGATFRKLSNTDRMSSVPGSLKQRHLLRKPVCICPLVLPLDGGVQARKHNQGQKGQTPRHIASGKGFQFR